MKQGVTQVCHVNTKTSGTLRGCKASKGSVICTNI